MSVFARTLLRAFCAYNNDSENKYSIDVFSRNVAYCCLLRDIPGVCVASPGINADDDNRKLLLRYKCVN